MHISTDVPTKRFLIAVSALATLLVGCSDESTESEAGSEAPSFPSSSSDDWFAAVCQPGTFADGQGASALTGADHGTAYCYSKPMGNEPLGAPIYIGTYSSRFKAENDVYYLGPYATIDTQSDLVQVFALGAPGETSTRLQPLARFGFELFPAASG